MYNLSMSKVKQPKRVDYDKLKSQFYESEHFDVGPFIRSIDMGNKLKSGFFNRRIKGWAEDKKQYKKEVHERALEASKEKAAKSLEIDMQQMQAGYKALANITLLIMNDSVTVNKKTKKQKTKLAPRDVETLQRIMNRFMEKPESYTKQDTSNTESNEDFFKRVSKEFGRVYELDSHFPPNKDGSYD